MKCPITGTAVARTAIQLIAFAAFLSCLPASAEIPTSLRHETNGTTLSGVLIDGTIVLSISASGLRGISASGLRGISASGLRGISASGLRGISASGLRGISASGLRGISASGLRGISASGLRGISASGLRGISASGLRGISASGLRGINVSGLRGISASGLRGISASGLRGISASGLRGISASGLRGISASGLRGISASGLRGISASGLRGISASGLRGISASGLRGISASGLRAEEPVANDRIAFQFENLPLVAIGAVSTISSNSNSILVLGQEIIIDEHTLIIFIDKNTGLPLASKGTSGMSKLRQGDYAAIAGEYMSPGRQLGTVVIKIPERFEASNSITYLRSKFVNNTDILGNVISGNSSVDYSGALYNPKLASVTSDDAVEYFGFTTSQNPNKLVAIYGSVVNEKFAD